MKKHVCISLVLLVTASFALAPLARAKDKDNNPPGPKGGPGSNWENPPGPQGGAGAGPDRSAINPPGPVGGPAHGPLVDKDNNPPGPGKPPLPQVLRNADTNGDGVVDVAEKKQAYELWKEKYAQHPPETPPGVPPADWKKQMPPGLAKRSGPPIDKDNNPPGPAGGAGTNWENPPGKKGGPGASPDKKRP